MSRDFTHQFSSAFEATFMVRRSVASRITAPLLQTAQPVPAEPSYGWYAGLSPDALSVGPETTAEDALEAARKLHGNNATIYVVEAKPLPAIVGPFGAHETERVVRWIDCDNAEPCGSGAKLPPLSPCQYRSLANRLNDAVVGWLAEHSIAPIGSALGAARSAMIALPVEVDSLCITPLPKARAPAGPTVEVEDDFHGWANSIRVDMAGCCEACPDPAECREAGCAGGGKGGAK